MPAAVSASVTVVICAYTERRWDDLAAGVAESRAQLDALAPADDHLSDVVVVIDHNPALLERAVRAFAGAATVLPNTRRQGLSGARNTAVDAAKGEVVVFLDDDAVPAPGWLAALVAPYADPRVLAVGGRAVPAWPATGRPDHLPAPSGSEPQPGEFDWVVGCTYAGQPTEPQPVRNLMGCNMSFRREVFATSGAFAEDLGRLGTVPLGCEETELCIRARRDAPDGEIIFTPAAVVHHRVSPDRTTWRYFWSRCRAEGISKAAVATKVTADAALATERGYVAQTLPRGLVRLARQLPARPRAALAGMAAIVGGVAVTGVGYLDGRIRLRGR